MNAIEHINMPVSYKIYPEKVEITLPLVDGDMNSYKSENNPEESPSRLNRNDLANCFNSLGIVLDFFHKNGVFQNGMHPGNILWRKVNGDIEFMMGDLGNCSILDLNNPNYLNLVDNDKRHFITLIKEFMLPSDRESGANVTFEEFLGKDANELLDRYEEDREFRNTMTCGQFVQNFLAIANLSL